MEGDPLLERESRTTVQEDGNAPHSGDTTEVNHVNVIDSDGQAKVKDFTGHLALAIAACTLGSSFQYGYNIGIVNPSEDVLQDFYNRTYRHHHDGDTIRKSTLTTLWAVTVSIYAVGGMVGGVTAGYWADRFGRKGTLLRNNVILFISLAIELSSKYTKLYELLIVGRFLIGINAGISTGLAPMYLAEIAPLSLRGMCGTFNQLMITTGVMISEIIGLRVVLGTDNGWPFAFGLPLIPAVFQLATLPFCPESPRYLLINKGEEDQAEQALIKLRGRRDVSEELEEMIAEKERTSHFRKFTIKDLVTSPALRRPLVISIMMQLSQQLSGINAVINYSTSIFMSAGLSLSSSQYATLGTGVVNVCMTFVSALLMDKVGRRTLHLTGLGGMFICSYILAIGLIFQSHYTWLNYICILAVTGYIMSFATGPGSIPWFYVAELFGQGPRPAAISVSVLVNWLANFLVAFTYPKLQHAIDVYSFIPFVVLLALFWLYTLLQVPETKGKTLAEIEESFQPAARTHNRVRYRPVPNMDT